MSEEEQLESIISEIKDIYIYLTQGKPTPDEEITARDKLINLIQTLKSIKTDDVESNMELFDDTLNQLENWDTLELWFVESELPKNIQKILLIIFEESEFALEEEKKIQESPAARIHEDLETASYDIEKIIDRVSEQFKGEIDELKNKIENLKIELEKKDENLKQISHNKVVKKITPKRDIKLPPPKIKIPQIKIPKSPPQVQAPKRFETEISKQPVGMKTIEEVQLKIEEEIERLKTPIVTEELIKKEEKIDKPIELEKKISKERSSVLDIIEESKSHITEPPNFTEMPKKPKKSSIIPEIIEVESEENEKGIPFTVQETEDNEKSETNSKPELVEKGSIDTKPKISSVSIQEIETESIHSTGIDLFNVFSSVGEKSSEKYPNLEDTLTSETSKEKKNKKEEVITQTKKSNAAAFVGFGKSKLDNDTSNEFETEFDQELPSDKDSLYQELIALEGKRYSLEKLFKELERNYITGSFDDFEYKKRSDDLRAKLNGITSKINNIRRVISSL
ncbi:MAG: hypothetical protein ACFFEY_13045 [Candidatus Thorarchaeota archaeon]